MKDRLMKGIMAKISLLMFYEASELPLKPENPIRGGQTNHLIDENINLGLL